MKRSAMLVAALAALAAAGCNFDTGAPSTVGQGTHILTGKVTNLTGTALQSVTVQVQPVGGGAAIRTMTTASTGLYRTVGLATGSYLVIVVMGDSSRITATGSAVVFVGYGDSSIAGVLTYDPGRVISTSLTYSVQDTLTARTIPFRNVRVWLCTTGACTVRLDSVRTSATGAVRFPARPGTYYLKVDTASAEFKAVAGSMPATILPAARLDTLRVSATFSANVTSSAPSSTSPQLFYRPPFVIQARIFKDKNADNVFNTGDSVISGVRVWLRRNGGTTNLGSSPATSGTSTAAAGNIAFPTSLTAPGLDSAVTDGWSLHVVRWYLPTGCSLAKDASSVEIVDYAISSYRTGTVIPTKDIPVTCP